MKHRSISALVDKSQADYETHMNMKKDYNCGTLSKEFRLWFIYSSNKTQQSAIHRQENKQL